VEHIRAPTTEGSERRRQWPVTLQYEPQPLLVRKHLEKDCHLAGKGQEVNRRSIQGDLVCIGARTGEGCRATV